MEQIQKRALEKKQTDIRRLLATKVL